MGFPFKKLIYAIILSMSILSAPASFGAEKDVALFNIHYQNASDLIEAVRSVMSGEGAVSLVSTRNAIVVVDYPYNIKRIRALLDKLDQTPKTVHITVELIEEERINKISAKLNWRIAGPGWNIGSVPVGQSGLLGTLSSIKGRNRQYLRLLESREGSIRVGRDVPVTSYYHQYGVNGGYISKNTILKETGTSFRVRARIMPNNKITISLSPEVSYYDDGTKSFTVKNASTVVIMDNPGSIVIGSADGDKERFAANFFTGVDVDKREEKFVMILVVRSE